MPLVDVRRIYPITIIKTRYGGVYEGGTFAAFNLYPEDIPEDVADDDIRCCAWWNTYGDGIGLGETPQAAYDALIALDLSLQSVWDTEKRVHYLALAPWPLVKSYVAEKS